MGICHWKSKFVFLIGKMIANLEALLLLYTLCHVAVIVFFLFLAVAWVS